MDLGLRTAIFSDGLLSGQKVLKHELGLFPQSESPGSPGAQSFLDQSPPGLLHALLCITLPNVSVLSRFAVAETTTVATTLARMTINSDAKSRCSILPPESNWFEGAARTLKHLCT